MSQNKSSEYDEEILESMQDRLSDEKIRLERQLKKEYRNARKYVRANPEEGITLAFAAGLFLGVVFTGLLKR